MPNLIEKVFAGEGSTPKNEDDPIPFGVTNLTLGSTLFAAIGLVADAIPGVAETILGDGATAGTRAALAIAIIGALALVYVADLLARSYASAHKSEKAAAAEPEVPAGKAWVTVRVPDDGGMTNDEDRDDWRVLDTNGSKVLVVKQGRAPMWVRISEVKGE